MGKIKIFIDPGHGGRDPGSVANGMRESDIALDVSLELERLLIAAGLKVRLSRRSDVATSIDRRWQEANAWGADLFVSVHGNGFTNADANGTEVFIFDNGSKRAQQSRKLANILLSSFVTQRGTRNRGVRLDGQSQHSGGLGVLRNTVMPAVLFESAFLTAGAHAPDVYILRNRRNEMAASLADGIFKYLNINPNVSVEKDDEVEEMRFQKIEEMPSWAVSTVEKLSKKGHLRGIGDDKDLSLDMLRLLVINDRAGLFD